MSENLPVKASEGANNGTYLYCDRFNYRRKYFVCLHTLMAFERGQISEGSAVAECGNAEKCGDCTASRMRVEEKSEGRAIYFKLDPYFKTVEEKVAAEKLRVKSGVDSRAFNSSSKSPVSRGVGLSGLNFVKTREPVVKKAKPVEKPAEEFQNVDMGRLITDLAKEETEVKQEVVKPKNEPLEGESMLDMAKRLIKERRAL